MAQYQSVTYPGRLYPLKWNYHNPHPSIISHEHQQDIYPRMGIHGSLGRDMLIYCGRKPRYQATYATWSPFNGSSQLVGRRFRVGYQSCSVAADNRLIPSNSGFSRRREAMFNQRLDEEAGCIREFGAIRWSHHFFITEWLQPHHLAHGTLPLARRAANNSTVLCECTDFPIPCHIQSESFLTFCDTLA